MKIADLHFSLFYDIILVREGLLIVSKSETKGFDMFFLYGKFNDMKRYEALDLTNQTFTNRLMTATFYTDKNQAEQVAESLMKQNQGLKVIVRKH